MQLALSLIALAVASLMLVTAIVDLASPRLRIWPPVAKDNWVERWFVWAFRAMFYALLSASVLFLWEPANRPTGGWMILGTGLVVLGFGLAIFATLWMGWRTAFGDTGPLACSGPFRFSRHPVYVSTWLGLTGWAILVPAPPILLALAFWAALYMVAIRLEEPWMLARFGTEYTDYARRTPRHFGLPRQR